ncbi:hypothetical protein BG003_004021 [Podila horticola]|nr:hypothetical protein BG003_004021 [Podila horticola]
MSTGNTALGCSFSSKSRNEAALNNSIKDKNQLKQLLLYNNFETTGPYVFGHETRYLDMITESDPQVTIRLVFLARQLPRSFAFAQMMAPLRKKYLVDTFMTPNENKAVNSESDTILGISGTLGRVCHALQDFLQDFAPARRGFHVWQLCILIPPEIQGTLVGDYESSLVYNIDDDWCETSVPELHSVLGRRYGPVHGNAQEDDHIFTIKSCSLDRIMAAVRYIGEAMIQNEAISGPAIGGFYMGGTPSLIPQSLFAHTGVFSAATDKYAHGLPVGYLVRPEMSRSQLRMLLRPFHLQLTLPNAQAVYLMSADRLHHLHDHYKAIIEISHNPDSDTRVCDIGGINHSDIAKTVAVMVDMLQKASQPGIPQSLLHPGWQVRVIVPRRVADALDRDETQIVMAAEDVDVVVEEDARGQRIFFGNPRERLESSEVEFTAVVWGMGDVQGIEDGIRTILDIMYKHK